MQPVSAAAKLQAPVAASRQLDSKSLYEAAIEASPGVDVSYDAFRHRLLAIAQECRYSSDAAAWERFAAQLHAGDLLLALGCAAGDATAWGYFFQRYWSVMSNQSRFLVKNLSDAEDLTAAALAHAISPGENGIIRIGCFQGRSSLSTWLRVLVRNLALSFRQQPGTYSSSKAPVEVESARRLENSFRQRRYAEVIRRALADACLGLSDRAQSALVLRYEHGLPLSDIARLLSVHESTVIRQINEATGTIRIRTLAFLRRSRLSPPAVQECITELVENPVYSVVQALQKRSASTPAAPNKYWLLQEVVSE